MANPKIIVDLFQVQLNFRNGHSEIVDREEAEQIANALNEFLQRNRPQNNWKTAIRVHASLAEGWGSREGSDDSLSEYTDFVRTSTNLPTGFELFHKEETDPKSAHKSVFLYARNKDGVYGFKVVNGKASPFFKLGRIEDPDSAIGGFIRAFPKNRTIVRSEIVHERPFGVYEGRRVKALVDILTKLGYLARTDYRLMEKRNSFGYLRTMKMDGLGVESNSNDLRQEKVAIAPNPTR